MKDAADAFLHTQQLMIQSSKLAVELWLNEAEDNAAGQVYTDKKVGRWQDLDTQQRELLAGRSHAFQKLSILKKQNKANRFKPKNDIEKN